MKKLFKNNTRKAFHNYTNYRANAEELGREVEVKKMIRKKFKDLGPMTFHEAAVLVLFLICVMLWFFRDPGFVPGWAHFIEDAHVDDATAVMLIVFFLFSIPAKPAFWCLRPKGGTLISSLVQLPILLLHFFLIFYYEPEPLPEKPSPALLDWKYVQDHLPWGIVLLLGEIFFNFDSGSRSISYSASKFLTNDLLSVLIFLKVASSKWFGVFRRWRICFVRCHSRIRII